MKKGRRKKDLASRRKKDVKDYEEVRVKEKVLKTKLLASYIVSIFAVFKITDFFLINCLCNWHRISR
jgi:hypothetical protein